MKILGVQFDYPGRTDYDRLAAVFERSVRDNCPAAELSILRLDPPSEAKRNTGMTSNWYKFKAWQQFIEAQDEGEFVILMDVDMMVLQDLRPAFKEEFDIALTRRTSTRWPYNGGVVFVKINPASVAFVRQWGEIDHRMYLDDAFHDPYKLVYKGQNQASLGWMVEHNEPGAKIVELPCARWNACNEDWMRFDRETTAVVHIKSNLRHYVLGRTPNAPSKLRPVAKVWKAIERKVLEEAEG